MPLDQNQHDELKEAFDFNDANGDGKIEFDEFVSMLTALDAFGSREEARVGFDAVDSDNDGSIDLEEFIAWWSEH